MLLPAWSQARSSTGSLARLLTVVRPAVEGVIVDEDRNRWRGRRSDGLVGEVTIPGRASADVGRHSDGHRRAWQGPAGPRFQLRRGCGGARSRPRAKEPINAHTGTATPEAIPVAQCGAGEQVQGVSEGGPLRRRSDQQLPVDRGGAVDAPPVQPLRVRLAGAAQPSSDGGLGPPEPGGDASDNRPRLRSRPVRCRSPRCCPRDARSARSGAGSG